MGFCVILIRFHGQGQGEEEKKQEKQQKPCCFSVGTGRAVSAFFSFLPSFDIAL